jgi:hypothetical protein
MKSHHLTGYIVGFLLCVVWSGTAIAGPTWICAITETIECTDDGICGEPVPAGVRLPTLVRVDPGRMEITLLAPAERRGEITVIETVLTGTSNWVFTGVEEERAWSLLISKDGYMTASVTYEGITWSFFGDAMLEE